ncbi:EAL domain-containing protein [Rubellimicrobium rubrum]|uniref:EAL domain-containing protein n=1 Tax=Rubellimicrobium rubrum TaxID=2585369 RepID=A0A5C4MSE7_9RHOB|nr:EAL domain-containing protein [Rubellimicrobium rubrum]
MHQALSRGEFTLHYQPVVQLDTGLVSAFWALLRWQHLRRGLWSAWSSSSPWPSPPAPLWPFGHGFCRRRADKPWHNRGRSPFR